MERCISCMKEQNLELDPNVETMLKTAIPQIKEYELYTTSPFSSAQDARKVIAFESWCEDTKEQLIKLK